MKKSFVSGIVLLSLLFFVGCSSNKDEVQPKEIENNTTKVESDNLKSISKELEETFTTDGKKYVSVGVDMMVNDETSDETHSVIEVTTIDEESRKEFIKYAEADEDNYEAKAAILLVQTEIESAAKKLENENDVIKFVNPDAEGRKIVIAMSKKNENIIPLKVLDIEAK